MNVLWETPSHQSHLVRETSDTIAPAAQVDLSVSAPQTATGTSPHAAEVVVLATPRGASFATGGGDLAWHEEIRKDHPFHDNIHGKASLGDEITAGGPCECEAGAAVAALDGVSKANLRRLETTLSQLHNEFDVCPLRDTAQPPPPPPRPIWLQKQETQLRPPPPPKRSMFWPRATTLLIACGIAAPLSYFAMATSPMHKYLVEVTEWARVASEPARRAPEPRDGIRASTAEHGAGPAQQGAFSPEFKTPAFPRPPAAETAIRSNPEIPPAEQDSKTANLQEAKLLIDRGRQFFESGDLVAARLLFLRAVIAGDAEAAVAMGATYDPFVFADRGIRGGVADLEKARTWYERAEEMGSSEGPRRLETLANR